MSLEKKEKIRPPSSVIFYFTQWICSVNLKTAGGKKEGASTRPSGDVHPKDGKHRGDELSATADSTYRPVKNDPAQLGLYAAQQLQLEEVLTQAICAPVASAQAAETGVAAERQETRAFTSTQTQHTRREGYSRKTQLFEPISYEQSRKHTFLHF